MQRLLLNLLFLAVTFTLIVPATQAQLISTDTAISLEKQSQASLQVSNFLMRDDVQQQLQNLGVSPEYAQDRVAALTPNELLALQTQINDLPAGGIIEVIGIVAVVLIILELVGVTNIFTNF
jgi:hypothetical protein